jgi:hypothetical protein
MDAIEARVAEHGPIIATTPEGAQTLASVLGGER